MYSGVIINNLDTYADNGLILLSDIKIGSPKLKEFRKDIPGANGDLNLSYAVTGRPTYDNREISFTLFKPATDAELTVIKSRLMAAFHGREVSLKFPFDKSHYYSGVIQIGDMSGYNSGKIPVSMTAFPYKYDTCTSAERWLWDDFDFESGIAREYVDLLVDGESTYKIIGSAMPVLPTFDVKSKNGAGITLSVTGKTYALPEGKSTIPGFAIETGEYDYQFAGTGTVTIEFRGGEF